MNKKTLAIVIIFLLALVALILFLPKKTFKEVVEYEVNNVVVNQTTYDYYDDIIHVGLNELCIDGEIVLVKSTQRGEEIDGLDLRGAIFTNGYQYLIYLYDLSKSETVEVLAHELIHLEQYRSKRLRGTKDSIYFEGKAYVKGQLPSYRDRPWEQEAFRRQRDLQRAIEAQVLE